MINILLLFSKLNPAIQYVQGMNEVLAPLCFVFSRDSDEQNAVRIFFICEIRLTLPCRGQSLMIMKIKVGLTWLYEQGKCKKSPKITVFKASSFCVTVFILFPFCRQMQKLIVFHVLFDS